jgi:tetratricopeptide (TPR) repeat protein
MLAVALALTTGCATKSTEPRLHVGVDRYHVPATTDSPAAQRWFDQGVQFCFGFYHAEAIRSFEEAARLDPDFAMAHWGIAYAHGPNINDPDVGPERHAAGYAAAQNALALLHNATEKEVALIRAVSERYAEPMPEDVTPLNEAYANAMRDAYEDYGTDPLIGTLYAESLMNLQPWDYWNADDTPKKSTAEIVAVLEKTIAIDEHHPGALHLHIHAMESGPTPEQAVPSGDKLRQRIPGSGHLVHMPSHIYAVVGRWSDAADANELAIAADLAALSNSPESDFYWGYYGHNLHFLAYAAMMECRYDTAMRAARQMQRDLPDSFIRELGWFVEGIVPTYYHVMIRFGQWDDILAEPAPPYNYLVSVAVHHYARSIALSALGRTEEAEAELHAFESAARAIPGHWRQFNNTIADIMPIARAMINAELEFRKGNHDEAFALLRGGALAEDALVYDEPPGWMIPVRHPLGALLMSAGRFSEAEKVYREDLERNPENGWGLLGLEQALAAQGKDTGDVAARLDRAWARADVEATSSCFCEPGRTYR